MVRSNLAILLRGDYGACDERWHQSPRHAKKIFRRTSNYMHESSIQWLSGWSWEDVRRGPNEIKESDNVVIWGTNAAANSSQRYEPC